MCMHIYGLSSPVTCTTANVTLLSHLQTVIVCFTVEYLINIYICLSLSILWKLSKLRNVSIMFKKITQLGGRFYP